MQEKSIMPVTRPLLVAAALGVAISAPASAAVWQGTTALWNTAINWSPSNTPDAASEIAEFNAPFGEQPLYQTHLGQLGGIWLSGNTVQSVSITKDPDATANSNDPHFQTIGTTINGNGATGVLIENTNNATLTLTATRWKVGASQSWINNSNNLFTVNARVDLDTRALTVAGSGNTRFTGSVTSSNSNGTLIKEGSGTLTLTDSALTYTGGTTVNNGTLLVNGILTSSTQSAATVTVTAGTLGGTGTINRSTTIAGTLAPGADGDASDRTLDINHSLTLGGTVVFDLFSADPGGYDRLLVNYGTDGVGSDNRVLTWGGTLRVEADPGMVFAAGQEFDLFDWGTKTAIANGSAFSSIELPALSGGLQWQVFEGGQAFDYETGKIAVVPEPAGLGIVALAGIALLPARRRRL